MNLRDTLATAGSALARHPWSGFLACFGVGVGIAALAVLLTLRPGDESFASRPALPRRPNHLEIFPGPALAPPAAPDTAIASNLSAGDVAAIGALDGVAAVAGSVRRFDQIEVAGIRWPVGVYVVDPAYFAIHGWPVSTAQDQAGFDQARLDPAGFSADQPIALIGSTLRDRIFASSTALGRDVRLGAQTLRIGGIVAVGDGNAFFADSAAALFLPMPSVAAAAPVRRISVLTRAGADAAAVQAAIATLLRQRHALGSGARDDFQVRNFSAFAVPAGFPRPLFAHLLANIAAIALALGGSGLLRIMLAAVDERRTEIGLRLATGAAPRSIQSQFLAEAMLISVAGGALGIVVAVLALLAVGLRRMPMLHPSLLAILLALLAALLLGALLGFLPARKAARLDAAAALRCE